MDPSNYNFGYGDNFGAGTDRNQSDPANQFGWASQWTQPASAAQAANTFPQYVSQHQQQQQQQAQQQAQNAYAALNPISTFMQQQQKPQFQKKFGNQNGGRPANRNNFGAFGGPPAPNAQMGMFGVGNEWVQPVSHNPMGGAGRGFQQQNRQTFPTKAPAWKNNQRLRPTAAQLPKKFDTTGKTPAMILHELFKTIGEEYTEIDGVPKRYRCTLTVNEQQFQMESVNKKAAKQKCAELVVRTLRPDLHMTPFEEGITAKAVPVPVNTGNGSTGNKRNADAMVGQAESKKKTSSKKSKKLTPVESAASLLDLMQKIIAESVADVKYNPVFEATEIQKEEPTVKIETDENEKKPPFRKNETQHSVTLKFVEQNKEYTRSGANRGMLKDMCIREALRDLFQVSQSDITSVARRHASNRLGTDMNVIQCLYTICSILNCTVTVECEPAEDKPLGDGKMFFMGKVSIVDFNEDGKTIETKSPSLPSKAMAKEFAAQEMLKSYFEIDPVMCVKSEGVNPQGPCSVLHAMLNKKTKQRTSIVYEFKDNVPPVAGQPNAVFYCDCVVDETDRYTGSGRSKKLAKNEAAMVALKKIFKIDFDPNQSYPLALSSRTMIEAKVSPMCRMLSEFCKREYHQMAEFYQVMPSNQIACFILLNEKEEKRLLSIGSSIQYIVEPDILNGANGTALIHMDAIVLARRALLRNLISELSVLETNPDQSVLVMKDGKAALKHNMKLYLYSNFSPVCAYSVDDAKEKSLAYVAQACLKPVPTEVLTFDEIKANKTLRIQCVADKVLKWNTLGVQGALLSNLMHPVFVESMFFGSEAPVNDDSLKYAMVNRLGENDREIGLESMPMHMKLHMGASHLFVRGSDTLESLEYNTGRTVKGSPSMACKAEIFAAYRKLQSADQSVVDYAKAKEMATEYQYEKKVFYDKLESAGLGKWQTKPAELADSFTLAAFD